MFRKPLWLYKTLLLALALSMLSNVQASKLDPNTQDLLVFSGLASTVNALNDGTFLSEAELLNFVEQQIAPNYGPFAIIENTESGDLAQITFEDMSNLVRIHLAFNLGATTETANLGGSYSLAPKSILLRFEQAYTEFSISEFGGTITLDGLNSYISFPLSAIEYNDYENGLTYQIDGDVVEILETGVLAGGVTSMLAGTDGPDIFDVNSSSDLFLYGNGGDDQFNFNANFIEISAIDGGAGITVINGGVVLYTESSPHLSEFYVCYADEAVMVGADINDQINLKTPEDCDAGVTAEKNESAAQDNEKTTAGAGSTDGFYILGLVILLLVSTLLPNKKQ